MGVEYRHYLLPRNRTYAPEPARVVQLVDRLRRERWVFSPDNPAFSAQFKERAPFPTEANGAHAFRTVEGTDGQPAKRIAIPVPVPVTPEWVEAGRSGPSADPQLDELAIHFPVWLPEAFSLGSFDATGLRYPFVGGVDDESDGNPYLEIVCHLTRDFLHHSSDCIEPIDTACMCGEDLGYEPDYNPRLRPAIIGKSRIHAHCPGCKSPFDPNGRLAARTEGPWGATLPPLDGGAAYRFGIVVDCGKSLPKNPSIVPELADLVASVLDQPLVDFGEAY